MSQHEKVETFISDTVMKVRDDIDYSYARQTAFNSQSDKGPVCVTLDPLRHVTDPQNNFLTNYSCNMFFYVHDKKDGTEKEYNDCLNQAAEIKEVFERLLNRAIEEEDQTKEIRTDNTVISTITWDPVIRATVDCLTGWIGSFTLGVPDTFNYCSVYE